MNDQIVFLPTAALGLLMVCVYSFKCYKNDSPFNVATMINIVLQSGGVIAGALLIASTFSTELRAKLNGIDIYVLISGIAVLVVSLQGLGRDALRSFISKDDE